MTHFVRTHGDGVWQGNAPVSILSVSPSSGSAGGFQTVVITGTGFTSATDVLFNGRAADSFVIDSSTQITAVTPLGNSPGTVNVTVVTSLLDSATDFFAYTFT